MSTFFFHRKSPIEGENIVREESELSVGDREPGGRTHLSGSAGAGGQFRGVVLRLGGGGKTGQLWEAQGRLQAPADTPHGWNSRLWALGWRGGK